MTIILGIVSPVGYAFSGGCSNLINYFHFNFVFISELFTTESLTIFGLSGFSLALMYGFGQLFRLLIGSIYVSPDSNLVRISHLTFFGNRAEVIVPINDILKLEDANQNLNDLFLQVKMLNAQKNNTLYICLKYGGILDRNKFAYVFGV